MSIAVNSLSSGSLRQGRGSLERASLLSNIVPSRGPAGQGAAAKTTHPGAPTPWLLPPRLLLWKRQAYTPD